MLLNTIYHPGIISQNHATPTSSSTALLDNQTGMQINAGWIDPNELVSLHCLDFFIKAIRVRNVSRIQTQSKNESIIGPPTKNKSPLLLSCQILCAHLLKLVFLKTWALLWPIRFVCLFVTRARFIGSVLVLLFSLTMCLYLSRIKIYVDCLSKRLFFLVLSTYYFFVFQWCAALASSIVGTCPSIDQQSKS